MLPCGSRIFNTTALGILVMPLKFELGNVGHKTYKFHAL